MKKTVNDCYCAFNNLNTNLFLEILIIGILCLFLALVVCDVTVKLGLIAITIYKLHTLTEEYEQNIIKEAVDNK